ncbi:MAG: hypothetical protein KA099_01620 [Alphaproteobacteria bacterium]|nr:hypothetical protein [Alphaproteobacteria bacterium]MBP7758209.1 hypothetical protein [Alphaproteobacteria bacterium]MBP7761648.1 hypothetical protein [Alphaproteobacteria bacterium]MBP7904000.1 hypothetical protein [Alphaproteobacteria bacterium]
MSGSGKEKEKLKIYEIAIFLAFFSACYLFSIPYKEKLFLREISVAELRQMSAQEYMKMMYWTSDLTFFSVLEDWPRKEDIPYILSLVESQGYTGTAYCKCSNSFKRISISIYPPFGIYGTTESIAALNLLKAIKEEKFEGYYQYFRDDKDEIIAWARAEAAKLQQEKAQTPSAPLP